MLLWVFQSITVSGHLFFFLPNRCYFGIRDVIIRVSCHLSPYGAAYWSGGRRGPRVWCTAPHAIWNVKNRREKKKKHPGAFNDVLTEWHFIQAWRSIAISDHWPKFVQVRKSQQDMSNRFHPLQQAIIRPVWCKGASYVRNAAASCGAPPGWSLDRNTVQCRLYVY